MFASRAAVISLLVSLALCGLVTTKHTEASSVTCRVAAMKPPQVHVTPDATYIFETTLEQGSTKLTSSVVKGYTWFPQFVNSDEFVFSSYGGGENGPLFLVVKNVESGETTENFTIIENTAQYDLFKSVTILPNNVWCVVLWRQLSPQQNEVVCNGTQSGPRVFAPVAYDNDVDYAVVSIAPGPGETDVTVLFANTSTIFDSSSGQAVVTLKTVDTSGRTPAGKLVSLDGVQGFLGAYMNIASDGSASLFTTELHQWLGTSSSSVSANSVPSSITNSGNGGSGGSSGNLAAEAAWGGAAEGGRGRGQPRQNPPPFESMQVFQVPSVLETSMASRVSNVTHAQSWCGVVDAMSDGENWYALQTPNTSQAEFYITVFGSDGDSETYGPYSASEDMQFQSLWCWQ